MIERPVQFASGAEQLCGILHVPSARPAGGPASGFVFVHGGSRGRLANSFQYPLYARRLAGLGYPCLRFDPAGIGDSSGTIETCPAGALYRTIQAGRFVPDTLRAIETLKRETGVGPVILFGLCGGAITALLSAQRSRDVAGLVLLSAPVMIDDAGRSWIERLPPDQARRRLSLYARKLLSFAAWRRLLTRQSESDTLWKLLKVALGGSPSSRPALNGRFLEALRALMAKQTRVLFLFGSEDGFRQDFDREVKSVHWPKDPRCARYCRVEYVPGCNHMFSMREWQSQALALTEAWLAAGGTP
jgi:pimeloyl-ACP methyl ester carboxylesterase